MALEHKDPRKRAELMRDKPQVDRMEHANYERFSAQFHPRAATSWQRTQQSFPGWRTR